MFQLWSCWGRAEHLAARAAPRAARHVSHASNGGTRLRGITDQKDFDKHYLVKLYYSVLRYIPVPNDFRKRKIRQVI